MRGNVRYTVSKREGIGGAPIPDDEPYIVIRAQDRLAVPMMLHYINMYVALPHPPLDDKVMGELYEHLADLISWQDTHPTKYADR